MTTDIRVNAFHTLGQRLRNLTEEELNNLCSRTQNENPWFTPASVKMALYGISSWLHRDILNPWANSYLNTKNPNTKTIALVMAGNIPLVGFHDLLCVLMSGHRVQIKLSSKDTVLPKFIAEELVSIAPAFRGHIIFADRLANFDAVIATGSDNSARYFDYYFGKYPNIIRKNRTSCAIIRGSETKTQLETLGIDVFSFFGLGCRNVSKLYVPENYDFTSLLQAWEKFHDINNHHKYVNNYDYQKSIMLVNGVPFLDTGFVMVTENNRLVSPISVVYFEYYTDISELKNTLASIDTKLQCIVGEDPGTIPFGKAQFPTILDYADHVDTMKFLTSLAS